jgi:hypothetical protein
MKPRITITKLNKYDKLMGTKYRITGTETLAEINCLNGKTFFKGSLLTSEEVDDIIKSSFTNKFAIKIIAE